MEDKNNSWLAVHLYYEEPWEEFLEKIIKPYCETVIGSGAAESYFFVRYWERGPHLRLRFHGEKMALENILLPNLRAYFSNVFSQKPSERNDPSYPPNFSSENVWFPNNSLQILDYEPEIQRYGGEYAMQIAERQFFASSEAVLASLEDIGTKHWSYEQALGIAIKLHLAFAYAVGFDLSRVKVFFQGICEHWLPLSIQRERITQAQRMQQNEAMIHTFEQFFTEQQEALITYHAAFWSALTTEEDFEEDYLNTWLRACKFTQQELRLAEAQGLLVERPTKYRIDFFKNRPASEALLMELYTDFFHMTNNRLGILNRDESYLGYLMMRSIENFSLD
jgi:Lantibiotic biosynthesis dehydratase C-term